ncbi:MAG TPA: CBS domain-containing protein [Denitromonas sp.]|nr:CBS domain-containing protein [Rhodocyclaceae bacterium]MCP5222763.1 CBS domain-containing protein [Zoogloeaceae bacterium]HQU87967.1 CBS domain-containing protein [Denitromonas sp.]HQV14166.1 CBS domain-containing protein [Denitromonas sp.]
MDQTQNKTNPLPAIRLGDVAYQVPEPGVPRRVTARSSAVEVMTDLHRVPAATIPAEMSLDDARQAMILRGVRMLLVTDDRRAVKGLVTASDLLGEQPVMVAQSRAVAVADLAIADIMTRVDAVEAFALRDVLNAHVGDVVSALRLLGRQHALVVEPSEPGLPAHIRGVFSASQIARQLAIPPFVGEVARTFAEIEAAIGA